jgi:hypothetical protein
METTRMETPLFNHHCKYCIFLGPYGQAGGRYDLYFCPRPLAWGCGQVVSRWGPWPGEFDGFLLITLRSEWGERTLKTLPATREALRRAEARGLTEQ